MKTSIWWIRRDFRLNYNPTLQEAIQGTDYLIPVFILDPVLLEKKAEKRIHFMLQALDSLRSDLIQKGSNLIFRSGNPEAELKRIVDETGAGMIYAEDDYSPYSRERDWKVAGELPFCMVNGLTVFPPGMIVKSSGCPYTVFTPYKRAWLSMPHHVYTSLAQPIEYLPPLPAQPLESIPLPAYTENPDFVASEKEAQSRFAHFISGSIYHYATDRERIDLNGTSTLSPYLRFGLISSQQVVSQVMTLRAETHATDENKNIDSWLSELIWREFYISLLHHFPEMLKGSFRRDLRNIRWRNDPMETEAWKQGETGYPIVDAGIRQLLQTGWMHNRARMITASFLVKDLLVNWQEGEAFFMSYMIDGDPAANNGGWQWTAGVGSDAVPYFRIFNPVLQGQKFDPLGDYVRRWVPELTNVPDKYIHKPWSMPSDLQRKIGVEIGKNYPQPIVDHQLIRKQTLAAFHTGLPRETIDNCGCS